MEKRASLALLVVSLMGCHEQTAYTENEVVSEAAPPRPNPSNWVLSEDVDPIDDSKSLIAVLLADSGANVVGSPYSLAIRCEDGITDLFIHWQSFLGSSDNIDVTSRIGDYTASTRAWSLSSDGQGTFAPEPIAYAQQIMKAGRFVARIEPPLSSPVTAIFTTSGMEDAMRPLQAACPWTL